MSNPFDEIVDEAQKRDAAKHKLAGEAYLLTSQHEAAAAKAFWDSMTAYFAGFGTLTLKPLNPVSGGTGRGVGVAAVGKAYTIAIAGEVSCAPESVKTAQPNIHGTFTCNVQVHSYSAGSGQTFPFSGAFDPGPKFVFNEHNLTLAIKDALKELTS